MIVSLLCCFVLDCVSAAASMPKALLASLIVAPVVGGASLPSRVITNGSSQAVQPPQPPLSSSGLLPHPPTSVIAAHTAVELRERKLAPADLTMNVDRQRDAIMDAVDQMAAEAWRHFPLRVKLVSVTACLP